MSNEVTRHGWEKAVFGDFARSVLYTRRAPTAQILGRTVEVITFNDERSESRQRGATICGCYVDEWSILPESFHEQLIARCSVKGAIALRDFGWAEEEVTRGMTRRQVCGYVKG